MYKVYKSVTNYAFIYKTQLFEQFKNCIICCTLSESKKGKAKYLSYMREIKK